MHLGIRLSLCVRDIVVGISAVDPAAHVYSHLVAIYYTSAPAGTAYCRTDVLSTVRKLPAARLNANE